MIHRLGVLQANFPPHTKLCGQSQLAPSRLGSRQVLQHPPPKNLRRGVGTGYGGNFVCNSQRNPEGTGCGRALSTSTRRNKSPSSLPISRRRAQINCAPGASRWNNLNLLPVQPTSEGTFPRELYTLVGHPGINKQYYTHRRSFYWPIMLADIRRCTNECNQCARERTTLRKHAAPMRLFPASSPLEYVAIDILGPFTDRFRVTISS